MTKGPGYLLPSVINPSGTRCITLEIPDNPGHIRAFLGQLDMLAYWWTWERDSLKQGTEAARRWRSVVDSARQQLDFFGDCPVGFDIRIQDCILQKSLDGGQTWLDVADLGDCAGMGPQGPQGPAGLPGADGADGADGSPVELRVYFGTIQWRVVGEPVWNHLLNLSEITGPAGADGADGATGADGPPIELQIYFGTIQWRVTGTTVWNHLINLDEICDCEEEIVNPNFLTDGLLCAIGYRVAAEIRKFWDDAYQIDPNVIAGLANGAGNIATFVGTFYAPFAVGAAKIAAGAGLVKWLDQAFSSSEVNSFTTATEYYIAEQIYCELNRRQQREITNDVLIDIAPHIYQAPDLTANQKLAVIGLILSAPEEAWQWSAYAAAPYPDGSACADADCDSDVGPWCVSMMGGDNVNGAYLLAVNPVVQAIVSVERGRLGDIVPIGYEATGGFGYPFLPDIVTPYPHRELRLVMRFPRPTQISRLEFLSNYNQTTATAIGTRLKVVTDTGTILINETVTGVVSGTAVTDLWHGDETVNSLTITGELWSDMAWGGFAGLKLLDVFVQGDAYNPFGTALANCTWEPPVAYDWCKRIDLRASLSGFQLSIGTSWETGVGVKSGSLYYNNNGTVNIFAFDRDWGYAGGTVVGVRFNFSGQRGIGGDTNMAISLYGPGGFHNMEFDYNGVDESVFIPTPAYTTYRVLTPFVVTTAKKAGAEPPDYPTDGYFTLHEIVLYGTGTPPNWAETEVC